MTKITAAMAAELADDQGVCRRPVIRRVHDRELARTRQL